jgi:hypothetical protein
MKTITKRELLKIKKSNRVVYIYPRKKLAVINGHRYYKIIGMTYAEMRKFNQ